MERKRLIMGVVALVAAGVLVTALWNGDGADAADPAARIAERDREGSSHSDDGSHMGSSASGDHGPLLEAPSQRAELLADGGVRRSVQVVTPRVDHPVPPPSENTHGELRRPDEDAARSAGWRLGQARARIELVDTRVTRLREAVAAAEQGGDPAAIERQRAVLRRFEVRLTALRAEAATLEAEATRDGTLGDVSRGMQEGVDATQGTRPPARAP